MQRPTAKTLAATLICAALPALMGADGGCTLLQDTLESPVQAITLLKQHADGTVEANLVVISTTENDHRFVDNAQTAEIRVPGGELVALQRTKAGHYSATSTESPALTYDADGGNYRVSFELDDTDAAGDKAGEDFIAVVSPPADEVSFELTKAPDFAGDTARIEWTPRRLTGLLEVRDGSGTLVYSTFNLDHPEFDGSKWGSLIYGGAHDLRVDVFAEPGDYEVTFCAVESKEGFEEEVAGGLGILSGFLAGRCAEPMSLTVGE